MSLSYKNNSKCYFVKLGTEEQSYKRYMPLGFFYLAVTLKLCYFLKDRGVCLFCSLVRLFRLSNASYMVAAEDTRAT